VRVRGLVRVRVDTPHLTSYTQHPTPYTLHPTPHFRLPTAHLRRGVVILPHLAARLLKCGQPRLARLGLRLLRRVRLLRLKVGARVRVACLGSRWGLGLGSGSGSGLGLGLGLELGLGLGSGLGLGLGSGLRSGLRSGFEVAAARAPLACRRGLPRVQLAPLGRESPRRRSRPTRRNGAREQRLGA
jgi:hypothetical protein